MVGKGKYQKIVFLLCWAVSAKAQYYYPTASGAMYAVPVVFANNPYIYGYNQSFGVSDMLQIANAVELQNARYDQNQRESMNQMMAWTQMYNNYREAQLRERQVAIMERQAAIQEQVYYAQLQQVAAQEEAKRNYISTISYDRAEISTQQDNSESKLDLFLFDARKNPSLSKYKTEIRMILRTIYDEVNNYKKYEDFDAIKRIQLTEIATSIFPNEESMEIKVYLNSKVEQIKALAIEQSD